MRKQVCSASCLFSHRRCEPTGAKAKTRRAIVSTTRLSGTCDPMPKRSSASLDWKKVCAISGAMGCSSWCSAISFR